jgi:hypothetical protein
VQARYARSALGPCHNVERGHLSAVQSAQAPDSGVSRS